MCSDKEFQEAVGDFKELVIHHLLENKFIKTRHDFTFCNRDILKKTCDKDIINLYDSLISKFQLTHDEFWNYLGLNYVAVQDFPVSFDMSENNEYLTLNIYPWAKKQDLIDSWVMIHSLLSKKKGYKSRLRGPSNLELLFAVKKARNNKTRFKDIANSINNKDIDGYEHKKGDKSNWDEETLKAYYHRNKNVMFKWLNK